MDSFWSRPCLNLGQAVSMKRTLFSLTMLLLPGALYAQDQDSEKLFRYNGYGYAFFSGGACQHTYLNVGAGGGGEGFLWHRLTLGGEIGYFRFPAGRNAGYGVFTIGPGYHFVNRSKPAKIDPYVNVGLIGGVFGPCCLARRQFGRRRQLLVQGEDGSPDRRAASGSRRGGTDLRLPHRPDFSVTDAPGPTARALTRPAGRPHRSGFRSMTERRCEERE
jgi:hypothetical protein